MIQRLRPHLKAWQAHRISSYRLPPCPFLPHTSSHSPHLNWGKNRWKLYPPCPPTRSRAASHLPGLLQNGEIPGRLHIWAPNQENHCPAPSTASSHDAHWLTHVSLKRGFENGVCERGPGFHVKNEDFESKGLRWSLGFWISSKFPGNEPVMSAQGPHFEEQDLNALSWALTLPTFFKK